MACRQNFALLALHLLSIWVALSKGLDSYAQHQLESRKLNEAFADMVADRHYGQYGVEDRDLSIGHLTDATSEDGVGDDDDAEEIPLDDEGTEENISVNLPSFKWIDNHLELSDAWLEVTFPDGSIDIAELHSYNPIPNAPDDKDMDQVDECIFEGHLQKDSEVAVTVSGGCPGEDTFDITIGSPKLQHISYNVKNGVVKAHFEKHLVQDIGNVGDTFAGIPSDDLAHLQNQTLGKVSDRALPANLEIKVVMHFDYQFWRRFYGNSLNEMRKVVSHTQAIMKLSGLDTNFKINVVAEYFLMNNLRAPDHIWPLARFTHYRHPYTDGDLYMYLSYAEWWQRVAGVAFVGTACSSIRGYKVAMTEYWNALGAAGTMAHEIGHIVGMQHDFLSYDSATGTRTPRSASNGDPCTDIGAIMDYFQPNDILWSECSKEDLTSYINLAGGNCLQP